MNRKLAAILSADVKGYSRLMGDDELSTVQTITAYRRIIGALIQGHRGRVVDSPGDNLLAEFGSAVDAVECAVKIQNAIEEENAALPENRKMIFRIGINIGDVIFKEGAIYGDGVNIAARLEGLAEAGGICISGTSYDQVKRKLPYEFDFIGLQQVKNIEEPIRAYQVGWENGGKEKDQEKKEGSAKKGKGRRNKSFILNVVVTTFLMLLLMPVVNYFQLNLLSKMWQCRAKVIPNSQEVVVVTISPGESRKVNVKKGEDAPPDFLENPKAWRRFHSKMMEQLIKMRAGCLGFDFWFSPAHSEEEKKATALFIDGLKLAKGKNFPVIVGQYRNAQEKGIYEEAAWGFVSVVKNITWLNKIMYLPSWDRLPVSGLSVERPAFFIQTLAAKLRLTPTIQSGGVQLIGKPVPQRLWLAFAETPFRTVPYHEVYNGWAEEKVFLNKIVLVGLCSEDTDYHYTPYSPTDFTPHRRDDPNGMPGVFLFAHAVNQVLNGVYYREINDEWGGFSWGRTSWSIVLEKLFFLLIETWFTCFILYFVFYIAKRKRWERFRYALATGVLLIIIGLLAAVPPLFGLANFFCAAFLFVAVMEGRNRLRRRK